MEAAWLLSPPRLSPARALVLLAAMVGLFVMHGLTGHGAAHWGEHATTDAAMPLVANGQPHEHVAAAAPVPSMVVAAAEDFTGAEDGRLPADMGLMELCLAVLALAGLLVATSMRAGGRPGDPPRTLLRQLAVPSALLGAADPPDRHRLQVHRC